MKVDEGLLAVHIDPIIKDAAKIVLSYYQRITNYHEKETGGLVTQADLESEKFLSTALSELVPGSGVFGEESGENDGTNDYTWVIDPLDGTTNFVHGLPYFCISVALTYKGKPQIGVVYNPLTEEYFSAIRGQGAYLNGKKIEMSRTSKVENSLIMIGLPYSRQERFKQMMRIVENISLKVYAFRHFGAAALDQAYLAAGRLDGVVLNELGWWDVAAGILLIEEAGGMVTDFEQNPIDKRYKSFIAAGKELYPQLLELIKSVKS